MHDSLRTGMTEACSSLTFTTLCDPTAKRNGISFHEETTNATLVTQLGGVCVGKPAPHVEIKISSSNGSSCDPFVGNIMTRGLHVMAGYWNHKELITLDFDEKGWLDTGDIGWIDCHGNLWLIGRKKACIKSGGENVYPEEVLCLSIISYISIFSYSVNHSVIVSYRWKL